MVRTATSAFVAARNPVVSAVVEQVHIAKAAYALAPCEQTRYQLVRAQERMLTVLRGVGLL